MFCLVLVVIPLSFVFNFCFLFHLYFLMSSNLWCNWFVFVWFRFPGLHWCYVWRVHGIAIIIYIFIYLYCYCLLLYLFISFPFHLFVFGVKLPSSYFALVFLFCFFIVVLLFIIALFIYLFSFPLVCGEYKIVFTFFPIRFFPCHFVLWLSDFFSKQFVFILALKYL